MVKNLSYFFQSIFIYFFFLVGLILRVNISRKLFSFLFMIIGPVVKSKKIINQNLDTFSQEISSIEKKNIINNMWKNYGKTFIEYVFLNNFKNNKSHIDISGQENLIHNIKKGKSVIFVSGHFANFELMSMEISKMNIQLATIYRPLNNFFLNPLMEFLRKKYICTNQIKKGVSGVRDAIELIKKKYSIALMIDQRLSEGERINFFDKKALTTTLPAQLSIKYNLEIIPVYIERNKDDTFSMEFQKAIDPKNFNNKIELTKKLNNVLEKMIIRNPSQWIWTHNRWK